jgi:hypothetical protein
MEGIIGATLIVGAYLLPGIVASLRGHHNAGAIWLTSLLLGWTGFGWIAALIWSATAVRRPVQYSPAYRELAGLK